MLSRSAAFSLSLIALRVGSSSWNSDSWNPGSTSSGWLPAAESGSETAFTRAGSACTGRDPSRRGLEPDSAAGGRSEGVEPGFQLSLFQLDDPTLSAIRDKLNAADLDNMTPMQAFDLLRSMKAELGL